MKCPSCGHEQADGWLSCQKCHVIFSRWKPGSVAAPQQSTADAAAPVSAAADVSVAQRPEKMFQGPPAEPPRPAGRPVSWLVYLLLILPFAMALYLLLNPKGRAVEPGSYIDNRNYFAIRAPEGWLTLTRENFDVIMRQYGAQIPAKLAQAVTSQNLAVSFIRLGPTAEFAPSMNVVIVKGTPPPINEKSKQQAAKAIAGGFAAQFVKYRQESVKIMEVDSIRSLEIVSSTSMPFQFSNQAGGSTLSLRSRQLLVPGKDRSYILTFSAGQNAAADYDASFEEALQSFRVLKRPPRFGPVINGGFIGGLVGAMFFLFMGMLRALGGERER